MDHARKRQAHAPTATATAIPTGRGSRGEQVLLQQRLGRRCCFSVVIDGGGLGGLESGRERAGVLGGGGDDGEL